MPREQLFFPLFERHAKVLSAGATALRQMLEGSALRPDLLRRLCSR
jgi:hypothetical protein